ncbi:hypothetical protein [Niallia taxi]|uniref:hypothetical protein n=1 Tax=Niallia taxi TaxID=2499688 RepID=UPI002E238352|nr:hypothetical protein [Niallia taxi]
MKKKVLISAIAISLLSVGTGAYAYNKKVEAAQLEQQRIQTVDKAENAVSALYTSDKTALATDLKNKLKAAKAAVKKVEDTKVKSLLTEKISNAEEISTIQSEVSNILKNGVVDEKASEKQVESISKKLGQVKDWNNSIYNSLSKQLEEADKQIAAINEAAEKVKAAEKSLKEKDYDAASDLIVKVKNEEKKEELTKQLKAVNETMVAKAEEAKRKEAEAIAKAEAEKATTVSNNASTSNVSSGSTSSSNVSSGSNSSSTSSSKPSSSSTYSSSNASTSSGSTSSKSTAGSSNKSNTSSSSKSTSSSSKSSASSNSGSSNSGKVSNVKKTGEGVINTNGSNKTAEEGSATYERGTFEWSGD